MALVPETTALGAAVDGTKVEIRSFLVDPDALSRTKYARLVAKFKEKSLPGLAHEYSEFKLMADEFFPNVLPLVHEASDILNEILPFRMKYDE